jgi:hypothetical protein
MASDQVHWQSRRVTLLLYCADKGIGDPEWQEAGIARAEDRLAEHVAADGTFAFPCPAVVLTAKSN